MCKNYHYRRSSEHCTHTEALSGHPPGSFSRLRRSVCRLLELRLIPAVGRALSTPRRKMSVALLYSASLCDGLIASCIHTLGHLRKSPSSSNMSCFWPGLLQVNLESLPQTSNRCWGWSQRRARRVSWQKIIKMDQLLTSLLLISLISLYYSLLLCTVIIKCLLLWLIITLLCAVFGGGIQPRGGDSGSSSSSVRGKSLFLLIGFLIKPPCVNSWIHAFNDVNVS